MATKTLAFEIGTEELPAFDLHAATERLAGIMGGALDAAGVPHGDVETYSTPRRLIMVVRDVPEQTEATEESFRGPSAKIAFDADGNPTKAAAGFARGKGVDVDALERRDEGGTEYVYAVVRTASRDVAGLLPGLLADVVRAVPWPKTQRWGSRSEQFSRPVRWLLALFGDQVVPVEFAGLVAGDLTWGHRFLAPGPHKVADADALVDVLRGAFVVPSEAEREASIREQAARAEEATGLVAELHAKTLQEVVNLAEFPTVMVGSFDELFLAVPKEITVDAMLVHQRYFPLFNQDGTLANKFLITSNGDPAFRENIVDGNERVVAARLYDAKFFYDEDLKKPLEAYVEGLSEVVFQEALGTTLEKTKRVVKVARHLAAQAGLDAADAADAERAAYLCKADLVTGAVVEFTSVQGVMGSYYAAASGETPQVAQAIADHYRPRFSGDGLPASAVGKVVAMADKLDTICGLFAIGQGPTGSSDPVRAAPRGHRHRVHPVRAPGRVAAFRHRRGAGALCRSGHRVRPGGRARRGGGLLRDAHEGHAARRGPFPRRHRRRAGRGRGGARWSWSGACARWRPRAPTRATRSTTWRPPTRVRTTWPTRRWARRWTRRCWGRPNATWPAPWKWPTRRAARRLRPTTTRAPWRPWRPCAAPSTASSRTCWSWTRTRPCARTGCAC